MKTANIFENTLFCIYDSVKNLHFHLLDKYSKIVYQNHLNYEAFQLKINKFGIYKVIGQTVQ